jgi:hypothetical protein
MVMKDEFKVNCSTREYIEKSYRYLYDLIKGKFKVVGAEAKEMEINAREVIQTGDGGDRHAANDKLMDSELKSGRKAPVTDHELRERGDKAREAAAKVHASFHFSTPKDFARSIGLPDESLEAMLKDHHERDQLVRVSVHENASFVKVSEGYPHYIYKQAGSAKNAFKFHEGGASIDLLDFYEGLQVMPRVLAAIDRSVKDLQEAHKPDNGLTSAALELMTYR